MVQVDAYFDPLDHHVRRKFTAFGSLVASAFLRNDFETLRTRPGCQWKSVGYNASRLSESCGGGLKIKSLPRFPRIITRELGQTAIIIQSLSLSTMTLA
jgi:hypothetical protein